MGSILILGGDGYLGWPTAMHFAALGHEVLATDNYLRRDLCRDTDSDPLFPVPTLPDRARILKEVTGLDVATRLTDLAEAREVEKLFAEFQPDTIIHYAEQPSAPYSMRGFDEASRTLHNNLATTHNLIWAVIRFAPKAHIIKLGTMGEYGTPNIDIEEGWINIQHKGREDRFLFPRQAGSLYHTTKVLDTDLLWFYVRMYGLRVTDLMQGPVYGMETEQTKADARLRPAFNYDDIFGTVVNRFLVQAVAGLPLTVFGGGGQTRGYLNLMDTLQCVSLAADNPPDAGKLEIYNQFTETFTVNQLADMICRAGQQLGIKVKVKSIDNPRKELEEHYYNPAHSTLLDMGLKPHFISADRLAKMMEIVREYKDAIVTRRIMPRVSWSLSSETRNERVDEK